MNHSPITTLDSDLAAVVLVMQRMVPASKLVAVARSLNDLAPILWAGYGDDQIEPMRIADGAFSVT